MTGTDVVVCRFCYSQEEPRLIEGRRRQLPAGWVQVQTMSDVGRTRNVIACADCTRIHTIASATA